MATPAAVLNTGAKVPLVGFGTWKAEPGRVGEAVRTALEAGYRHIDCAAVYGNEKEIGQVFKEIFSSGKVKRSDVFVTSKLWNTCHKKEHVIEACKQTLKDLQLDYLDLYLIHWPCAFEFAGLPITEENTIPKNKKGEIAFAKVPLQETWKAMEELQKQGLVKAIGVSNYRIVELLDLLSYCEIVPAVNQIEVHPYNQRKDLKEFCESRGIHVTAYSPLGSGKEGPLQDSVVRSISEKLGKTPAQVLLAWGLQRGTSVIPKSVTPTRIKENLNCTFKLDSEVVKQIDQLERGQVVCDMREYWGFPIDA
ncbi:aldo/keto reductase [Galdieria sulphuraria]|uniref:Aldo/keto reductase n=1 Tax=Galdieria sulphuraria TaxID=130081 RepID=M2X224_GALSU|nr:aldo/keto reductase [Galdieria sulphuraria]EME30405.1 aldo/keto reductase [Galdieria sulphuraria]|eukprot:XP_005706925.1 aldo/keto reductase [Galdieria sulphuraria]